MTIDPQLPGLVTAVGGAAAAVIGAVAAYREKERKRRKAGPEGKEGASEPRPRPILTFIAVAGLILGITALLVSFLHSLEPAVLGWYAEYQKEVTSDVEKKFDLKEPAVLLVNAFCPLSAEARDKNHVGNAIARIEIQVDGEVFNGESTYYDVTRIDFTANGSAASLLKTGSHTLRVSLVIDTGEGMNLWRRDKEKGFYVQYLLLRAGKFVPNTESEVKN